MISLEHIRTLESKVTKAVELMAKLQANNLQLKVQLDTAKARIEELEFTVEEYREDQTEIEQGLMQALQHLDNLENAVGGLKPADVAIPIVVVAAPVVPVQTIAEEAPAPVETASETPIVPVQETHWEAPVQQFQQPAPVSVEEYESVVPADEPEAVSTREQQLDIF